MKHAYVPIEPKSSGEWVWRRLHRLRSPRRMRLWRIVGLVALLLAPFTFIGLATVISVLHRMPVPNLDCRGSRYCMLWKADWGGERDRHCVPLSEREQKVWQSVVTKARAKGFQFSDPRVFRTDADADGFVVPEDELIIYGAAYPSGRIMLSGKHLDRMSDDELCVLMAHELGHQVDNQTERVGNPFLHRLRNADPQALADEFAREVCGTETVTAWKGKWQSSSPWAYVD